METVLERKLDKSQIINNRKSGIEILKSAVVLYTSLHVSPEDIIKGYAAGFRSTFSQAKENDGLPVLVCARDEEVLLPVLMLALARTKSVYPLVVDNGSKDSTSEIAKEMGAEVVFEGEKGLINALARGFIYLADTGYKGEVLLTDADSFPIKTWPELMRTGLNKKVENGYGEMFGPIVFYGNVLRDSFRTLVSQVLDHKFNKRGYPRAHGSNAIIRGDKGLFGTVGEQVNRNCITGTDDHVREVIEHAGGTITTTPDKRPIVFTIGDRYKSITEILRTYFNPKWRKVVYGEWFADQPDGFMFKNDDRPRVGNY